jgi:hypothetical protein
MPKALERASGSGRYYRVRQRKPAKGVKTGTLTYSKKKGYKAVRQKIGGKWVTQSVLIEKRKGRSEKFAEKKAKELTKGEK